MLAPTFLWGIKHIFKTPTVLRLNDHEFCFRAIVTALNHAFALIAGMSIQNNLSETINGVLAAIMRPRGPRTATNLEQRLRARIRVRNDPRILGTLKITLGVRGDFSLRNVAVAELARLGERGWEIDNLAKLSA